MNEKWLSKKLRQGFTGEIFLMTFEACGLPDVPDLYAIAAGGLSCWIELKCVDSDRCLLPFRKGQPGWIANYLAFGGKVFVLVLDRGSKNLFLLQLVRPKNARLIITLKLREAFNAFGIANWRISLGDFPRSVESKILSRLA